MANTEDILIGHHYLVTTSSDMTKDWPDEIEILAVSSSCYKLKYGGVTNWIKKEAFNRMYTIVEHLPRDLNSWAE